MPNPRYTATDINSDTTYPYCILPSPGVPLYPLRHSERAPRPVAAALRKSLAAALPGGLAEVTADACLKFADGGKTYRMAVAVVCCDVSGKSHGIDIEIDAPYSASTLTPQHYIESSADALRDDLLRRHGWATIRFSERQAAHELRACRNYVISKLAETGIPGIAVPSDGATCPSRERKYSRLTAEKAAADGIRALYLSDTGLSPSDDSPYYDPAPLTSEERRLSLAISPAQGAWSGTDGTGSVEGYNLLHLSPRDSHIRFIPQTHTYLYDGCDALSSVTSVISEYFPAFDARAAASRKAGKNEDPQKYIDQWNFASREASESGTHMHAQIERYLLGKKTNTSFHLRFSSPTFCTDTWADVSREFSFFLDFIGRSGLTPYRTEWPVYDTEHGIAGSPDLIAEKDGKLMMFDWKRSTKVIDPYFQGGINARPNLKCWGRYGSGPLSDLPDCSFIHYSLQQAVYKRILRYNYGIDLSRTFLVVLHPRYSHFYIIETMDVEKYVDAIFSQAR